MATSDEADDVKGSGDGNTKNDIVIAAACKSVMLRRERAEGGNGRVYKITVRVKDLAGNIGSPVRQVFVPLSGAPAVDSGVQYSVTGCSP